MSAALVLSLTLAAADPGAGDTIVTLGAQLATLRAEVDGLAADIEAARAEAKEEQLSSARRRASLETDLATARITAATLQERLALLEAAGASRERTTATFEAPVRSAVDALRTLVASGMPFQIKTRLARLQDVEARLADGPAAALAALEAALVEEARLARTTQRVRMPVTVAGGGPVIADVIRFGTVALVFRAPDGLTGRAVASAARVTSAPIGSTPVGSASAAAVEWRAFETEEDRALARALFDVYRAEAPARPMLVPRAAFPASEAP